ncbi:cohesin subunit SA-3-like [Agelaius tricolor]|uniref:cohesin subunit SA-3-like n=1 Tax=Agelaius tricolor TaxID=9191 RepID=UPI0039F1DB38
MAPRRSPRLRPSGSSSGSSSGPAPGSAPRSGSPSSPEFPDGSDSGSDFEASLRPRSKRGPPRGAPGSLAPKRSRVSGGDGRDPEENSLFEAVFSGKVATETLVDEWLEWYRRDREPAFLELLNFTVRSCGCRGVVTPQMFRELQNSEIIRRLTETFQEDSPEYPLSLSSPPWPWFHSGFCALLAVLVQRGQHWELQDGFLSVLMDTFTFIFIFYIYIYIFRIPPMLVSRGQHRELQDGFLMDPLIHFYFYLYFQDSPEYPLSLSSPPWPRFRSGFSQLLAVLVSRGQHRELQDGS